MKAQQTGFDRFWVVIMFVSVMTMAGCSSPKVRQSANSMDTLQHHVYTGMNLLEKNSLSDARREFKLAIELDPEFSPAYVGLGLVAGREGGFKQAFDLMLQARKGGRSNPEKALAHVGFMRLYTLRKQGEWLADAEESFQDATRAEKELPDAHFFMGVAYKESLQFGKAADRFKFVMSLNRGRVGESDEELRLLQKIERAMPGSEVGRNLAIKGSITRAEAAAIFVHELKLPSLMWSSGIARPGMKTIPADIKDHPLRADVESVCGLNIRGLTPYPDGRFEPDAPLPKAAYAMMLDDIIVILARDPALSAKYVGNVSPFSDVDSAAPYFNAVMLCTARGIVEPADLRTGRFAPQGNVSGADALLAIRRVKEEMKIY